MRVNPIMDWGYTEVWALLRGAHLPYCSLYDKGYTSIGATSNTAQNGSAHQETLSGCGEAPKSVVTACSTGLLCPEQRFCLQCF